MPVTAVTESQSIDAAQQLVDVYEITYTIPSRPGVFTVEVPKNDQALAEAEQAINALTNTVNALYNIP
jgi:hypothetical protein